MNNMKYYNDSLAYDFDMFMPKTAEETEKPDNIVRLPKERTAARKRQRAAASSMTASAFAVMSAVFILAGLCGNIFLRLQINETNSQISDIKTKISELDSEKTSLEVELQRRISYQNIELEATELGMKKLEKNQVIYIRVNDRDTARTGDGNIVSAE